MFGGRGAREGVCWSPGPAAVATRPPSPPLPLTAAASLWCACCCQVMGSCHNLFSSPNTVVVRAAPARAPGGGNGAAPHESMNGEWMLRRRPPGSCLVASHSAAPAFARSSRPRIPSHAAPPRRGRRAGRPHDDDDDGAGPAAAPAGCLRGPLRHRRCGGGGVDRPGAPRRRRTGWALAGRWWTLGGGMKRVALLAATTAAAAEHLGWNLTSCSPLPHLLLPVHPPPPPPPTPCRCWPTSTIAPTTCCTAWRRLRRGRWPRAPWTPPPPTACWPATPPACTATREAPQRGLGGGRGGGEVALMVTVWGACGSGGPP